MDTDTEPKVMYLVYVPELGLAPQCLWTKKNK